MKPKTFLISVSILILVTGTAIGLIVSDYYARKEATDRPATEVVIYKNAGCQCCDNWTGYMQRYGYNVTIYEESKMPAVKDKNEVPGSMESCHMALVDGHVVEGHVPLEDINRLLKNRPDAIGIAAPGMPVSSPGMNTAPYVFICLGHEGISSVYASH